MTPPKKISLGAMRAAGVRGLVVTCSQCAHLIATSADAWRDEMRLCDLEPLFVCKICGHHGADVQPDFDWDKPQAKRE